MDALVENLKKVLAGQLGIRDDEQARSLMDRHLAARNGPLASERIVQVLDKMTDDWKADKEVSFSRSAGGLVLGHAAPGQEALPGLSCQHEPQPVRVFTLPLSGSIKEACSGAH
jgi:hypothetical protein